MKDLMKDLMNACEKSMTQFQTRHQPGARRRVAPGLVTAGLCVLGIAATAARAADAPSVPDIGEHIYTTVCQGCHMSQGEGAVGAGTYPKLAGNPTLISWQYVAVTVLNGRHGMPSFGVIPGMSAQQALMSASLTDEQVTGVVNYVRTHFGNRFKDKATIKQVEALPHPGGKGSGQAG